MLVHSAHAARGQAPPSGKTGTEVGYADGAVLTRYRSALRATIAASAAPYGYTLTVWTSGAVLSHARGIPSAAEALLFLGGAVAAYALVAAVALRGSQERLIPEPATAAVWGACTCSLSAWPSARPRLSRI